MTAAQVEVSTDILIQKVKEHRELWDRYTEGYRRRIDKDQAWRDICEEVVPNFSNFSKNAQDKIITQLTKKWFNVRDSYVKFLKSHRRNKTKAYRHSEMLGFLDTIYIRYGDSYDQGPDKTNDEDTEDLEYDDKASEDEPEAYVSEVFFDMEENVKPPKQMKTNLSRAVPGPSTPDALTSIVSNLIEREDDEDKSFFNSIMPTVKRLSNDSKLQFRIEVMTLLRKYTTQIKQERDPIDGNDVDI